jgi:hypothetical protein
VHQRWKLGIGGPCELVIRSGHGLSLEHRNSGGSIPVRFKLDGILYSEGGIFLE